MGLLALRLIFRGHFDASRVLRGCHPKIEIVYSSVPVGVRIYHDEIGGGTQNWRVDGLFIDASQQPDSAPVRHVAA